MSIIITYGTFDLFHIGHLRILQRAKEFGDKLYVGISSDEFNLLKHKRCTIPYIQRAEIVKAIRYVDDVFPENSWEQKEDDIIKLKADILIMGNDWEGKFNYLSHLCEVKYLPRTEDISTTQIKETLYNKKN